MIHILYGITCKHTFHFTVGYYNVTFDSQGSRLHTFAYFTDTYVFDFLGSDVQLLNFAIVHL